MKNCFIYKITSGKTAKCYVGATERSLRKRFNEHKTSFKKGLSVSSVELIKYGDAKIELLECTTKEEMKDREAYYIKTLNCVNKNIPNRNRKQWYEHNQKRIREYRMKKRPCMLCGEPQGQDNIYRHKKTKCRYRDFYLHLRFFQV